LSSTIAVSPEEAALAKTLFSVDLPVEAYAASKTAVVGSAVLGQSTTGNTTIVFGSRQARGPEQPIFGDDVAEAEFGVAAARVQNQYELDPGATSLIKYHIDAIQDTFRKNLAGIYFRQNFIFAGLGILATFIWGLLNAVSIQAESSVFLTFWLLMFTSIAGLVIGGVWTSKPTQPTRAQNLSRILLPVLFFGVPGTVIYLAAMPHNHGFVLALLLSVALNNVFFVLMRAPTALGRATLQQLAGLREFLMRVEQDRFDRLNAPEGRAELMNRLLPYAIALGVREGWGDTMAAAFSDAIVER
jgi:hypothetical protein